MKITVTPPPPVEIELTLTLNRFEIRHILDALEQSPMTTAALQLRAGLVSALDSLK